jgi:carbonic anhydrase
MVLWILAGVVVFVAGIVWAAHTITKRQKRERAESVQAAAERLGWSFRDEVPYDSIPDLGRFELFNKGGSRKIRNVMASPRGDPRVVVFDFSYYVSSGNSGQTIRQTVFYASSDTFRIPSFSLRPENFFHKVAGIFGYQDINFDRRPEFSRMFLLRGEDEPAIRELFEAGAAERFERRPGACAAGMGHELLLWHHGKVVDGEELDAWIRESYELAGSFGRVEERGR